MEFDRQAHIARMKPSVDKLLVHLQKKGISFSPTDGELDNVVLTSSTKTIKISHHSFYRYSGICCIYKEKGENFIEAIDVTDEMFMNNFMRPIVEMHFA